MRDYLKEFSGDVIGDFLAENDIVGILKEGTSGKNAPTDDGPPTFYKNLTDYKKESKSWVESLQNDLSSTHSLAIDVSDRWTVINISGNKVTDVLSKGTFIDLDNSFCFILETLVILLGIILPFSETYLDSNFKFL